MVVGSIPTSGASNHTLFLHIFYVTFLNLKDNPFTRKYYVKLFYRIIESEIFLLIRGERKFCSRVGVAKAPKRRQASQEAVTTTLLAQLVY